MHFPFLVSRYLARFLVSLAVCNSALAQTLYVPGGSNGVGNNTANGNIGIGTSNPNYTLDVAGNVGLYGTVPVLSIRDTDHAHSSTGIAGYISFRDSSGTEFGWVGDGSQINNYISVFAETNHGVQFGAGGLARMWISSEGNVGIGTSSPGAKLEVNGGSSSFGLIVEGDGAVANARIALRRGNAPGTSATGNIDWIGNDNAVGWRIGVNDSIAGSFDIKTGTDQSASRLLITRSGNVGIGTTAPQARLHSSSAGDGTQAIFNAPWTAHEQQLLFKTGWNSNDAVSGFAALGWKDTGNAGGAFWISTLQTGAAATSAPTKRLYIDYKGDIGVGKINPAYKLDVAGTIRAEEIMVQTGGADYVFADDYQVASLAEVERHIKEHKHLPDIPSAKEMTERGVGVSELQTKLLAKVEELTLHLIAQEKRLNEQAARIEQLERENNTLRLR